MKKIISIIHIFLLSCMTFSSCTLETSDNGKLDGYWQLSYIDTLANGHSINMRNSGIFWGIQKDLLITRSTNIPYGEIIFNFEITNDSIKLSNPYILNRDSSDIKVSDISRLKRFGINELEERFHIINLQTDEIILKSKILRLYFRKY